MKILYVSDLDGTLLRSDETLSDYTCKTINKLVDEGMMFSYATARSYQTAHKATKGLDAKFPLIVYNGTMVVNNSDASILICNYFKDDDKRILDELLSAEIYPIVYAFIDGVEKFSYVKDRCNDSMQMFLNTRKNDVRENPVYCTDDLYIGEIFYITCIDEKGKLEPFYHKYMDKYNCVFDIDLYTKKQWFEIMPKSASKANAIKQLKEYLKCDKVIAFGDGKNDIDMFKIADESYATENAVAELKEIATAVIDSNNNDGVAKWLERGFKNN